MSCCKKYLKPSTAGITAFTRTLDEEDMNQHQKDALALFCNTQYELNNIRKKSIQPVLDPKFAGLCRTETTTEKTYLFGGDLPKRVKDLDEESKALGIIKATKRHPQKYHPYALMGRKDYSGEQSRARPIQHRSFLGHGPGRPSWKMHPSTTTQIRTPAPQRPRGQGKK